METDSLRVTKLRTYLLNVIASLNDNYKQLNINFLSDDVNNYSLDKIPTASVVENWINGISLHRDVYNFRSRNNYSADEISNIENIGFFEKFENAIEENNKNKTLPEIEGIEAIRCLNVGTMANANTNSAEFDIQIQIEYRR